MCYKITGFLLVIISLTIATGCSVKPSHVNLKNEKLPDIIPVRDFVANIKSTGGYRISPDGHKLAWMGAANLQRALFVKDLNESTVKVINIPARSKDLFWSQDSENLLMFQDNQGNENRHIIKFDMSVANPKAVDLTPWEGVKVSLVRMPLLDKEHIYIKTNENKKSVFDLYRLNYKTGKKTLLEKNNVNVTRWWLDESGDLRARSRVDHTKKQNYLDTYINNQWKTVAVWTYEEQLVVIAYPMDKSRLLVISNRGRDKLAVASLSVESGKEDVIYQHPTVDITGVFVSKIDQTLLAVSSMPDYPEFKLFDNTIQNHLKPLLKRKLDLTVHSRTDDERKLVIRAVSDKGSEYYLYSRDNGQIKLLAKSDSLRFANKLAEVKPFKIKSRDGLDLHGYLTLPVVIKPEYLPTVLLVHGGPWGRDRWGYNRFAQMLANRGYAVLQVNYRGSAGYGRRFMQAAMGEFAAGMHNDLIDIVDWAVSKGIADPKKIAIAGFSYGGYATLVGLTKTPEKFACGFEAVGPSDLASLIKKFPVYWKNYLHYWHRYVGNPDKVEDLKIMKEKSPVYFADRVVKPLMIIQTENDVRVRREQSDMMVAAMKKAKKPVDYIVIKGEGHGFRHWKTRLKLYRHAEDFLAECLGGRSSGFDYYQLGTWMF